MNHRHAENVVTTEAFLQRPERIFKELHSVMKIDAQNVVDSYVTVLSVHSTSDASQEFGLVGLRAIAASAKSRDQH